MKKVKLSDASEKSSVEPNDKVVYSDGMIAKGYHISRKVNILANSELDLGVNHMGLYVISQNGGGNNGMFFASAFVTNIVMATPASLFSTLQSAENRIILYRPGTSQNLRVKNSTSTNFRLLIQGIVSPITF